MRGWIGRDMLAGVAALVVAAVLWIIPSTAMAQEEEVIANGHREYQWYCEFCHGEKGKGDGPMTLHLVIKPTDLTQLQKTYGGNFPVWYVYGTIDGRQEIKGHGTGAMPIWGKVFTRQERATRSKSREDVVRGRILSLVHYLKSIQEQ